MLAGSFIAFALAGQSLSFYFTKCFWPVEPAAHLSQVAARSLVAASVSCPGSILVGVIYWLWTETARIWSRMFCSGLGFFILSLVPFSGLHPVSYMSFTWVMDHFLYIPIIGLIGIVVAGIESVDARLSVSVHPLSTGILTVIMGLLAFESHWYAAAFTSEETFWNYTIDRNPGAWLAHNNLGKLLLQAGESEQAMEQFNAVIQLKPELGEPYNNLGNALVQLGRIPEASAAYNESLKRDPYSPETNNNLGILVGPNGTYGRGAQPL